MITISLCMIVKNEGERLSKCLDSLKDLVDEILIADTGSDDNTKEIAHEYGAKVFDFKWNDDFSEARNFIFEKATCDYIYSADADEELDHENQEKFKALKEAMDPRIEMVEMYYKNQLEYRTVYNYDRELRPKLFKRVRKFIWEDPIHEQVRLSPLIFESDIEIIHRPSGSHADRDLKNFRKAVSNGYPLSNRLINMYARELYMAGEASDFAKAVDFMTKVSAESEDTDTLKNAIVILERAYRLMKNNALFNKYALKDVSLNPCSETCMELGEYYFEKKDFEEALIWFYNAYHETEPILDIRTGGSSALSRISDCYEELHDAENRDKYYEMSKEALEKELSENSSLE